MSPLEWERPSTLDALTLAAALGLPAPTPEQRAVIEAPPGPALVVAGAGSGKTETIAARVVWLVANGHVERDQILGLTFTRKAAGELAERIMLRLHRVAEFDRRGLLPHLPAIVASAALRDVEPHRLGTVLDRLALRYETGYLPHTPVEWGVDMLRPRVSTYNAFADAIVREHAARVGRDPDATLLSQSGSWLLARRVVVDSGDERLAEQEAALSTIVDAVSSLAAEALDNRADLDEVAAYASGFAAQLAPVLRDDVKPQQVEHAYGAANAVGLIARLAQQYADAKAAQNAIDFADQVAGALEVAERSPGVVAELREQYRVVLLDEYQDTSVMQTRLLSTLFHDHTVMAVGDPHQSIYSWRGASADNLDTFARAFSDDGESGRYELMVSWRNDESILRAANALLRPLQRPERLQVGELVARPAAGEGDVDVVWMSTLEEEADAVASWFAERRGAADDQVASRLETGAILFRAKRHMQTFAEALERHGVPHRILGLGGLLSTPEITDILAGLRVIHDPSEGSSLIRLLAGPRFRIGVADLAALQTLARRLSRPNPQRDPSPEAKDRIRNSAGIDEQLSIIDALDVLPRLSAQSPLLAQFSAIGRERLQQAGALFDRLRRQGNSSIPELIRLIESDLRLDIELGANEARGSARVATTQLQAFLEEVRGFLATDPRGTVSSLLAWLTHAESTDELMPRLEAPEPGVVQLLTIHGAKGLEWDATAVVRLVETEVPKQPKSNRGWLSLGKLPYDFRGDVDALPRLQLPAGDDASNRKAVQASLESFFEQNRAYQLEEERRLAYVAVTRARSKLLLSGSSWAGQTRARKPSTYLHEMLDALGREPLHLEEAAAAPETDRGHRIVQWPADPLGERRATVEQAAKAVAEAEPAEASEELVQLLAERALRARRREFSVPARIPASLFKDYVTGFQKTAALVERPMPERPFTQTRIGTDFHAWVEQRFGLAGTANELDDGLWSDPDALDTALDDDDTFAAPVAPEDGNTPTGSAEATHQAALAEHQQHFLESEWANLQPLEVETELHYVLQPPSGGDAHIVICKLDAVFRREDRGGRIEIVDWKTGRPPRTAKEREDRLLQLAHYRIAYHHARGVPLEEIDVALFYVGHGVVLRPDRVMSEAELGELWVRAQQARGT